MERQKGKMHILLTGEIQVGKSTIIQRFLSQSGLAADGFLTYWDEDDGGGKSLFLSPYAADLHNVERRLITKGGGYGRFHADALKNVFDEYGCEVLDKSGKQDIIIMDELGFLESNATKFHWAVMRHISGDVPILGVIKPARTKFLNDIRARKNVVIRDVTVENRDEVLKWVAEQNWKK